jgi:LEA14-like dessication related protein
MPQRPLRPVPTPPRRSGAARTLALASLVLLIAACAPATTGVLAPPTFRLVPEGTGLTRLDLPGFGSGGATFRVVVDAHNPNPVGVRLAVLDGDLFLNDATAARASFPGGVDLPGRGQARLTLDVTVPTDRLPALLGVFGDVLAGRAVGYRLDGVVGIEVLGSVQRFPSVTLVQGTVQQDLALRAPIVSIDRDASGVREISFDRVTIDVGLRLRNPNVVGLEVRAPDARLRLGDRDVATIQLSPTRLPSGSESTVVQRIVLNPVQLGAAIVAQLQQLAGGQPAAVDVVIVGRWELEVPGLRRVETPLGELVRGRLD